MRKYRLVVTALVFTFALASGAFAEAGAEEASLELYPTYYAVGLEVKCDEAYAGATASFVWRVVGSDRWRNGVDMTYDRSRRLIWASIWPLDEGQAVEVKVSLDNPYSTPGLTLQGSTTTRTMILAPEGGREFYVSPSGDDANAGAKDSPWRTLAHAAGQVKPGDIVNVGDGVYRESGLFGGLSGTAEAPIVFRAAEGAAPVIDESSVIEKGSGGWEKHEDGIWKTSAGLAGKEVLYVSENGLRVYMYRSLEELRTNKVKVPRAWFFDDDADTLYMSPQAAGPEMSDFRLAHSPHGIDLTGSNNVVVQGFEVRNFGKSLIHVGEGARDCVVIGNTVHNAANGITFAGRETTGNAIWGNRVYERGLIDFTWEAIKASDYGRQGIVGTCGRGLSMCRNVVSGWFDGICPYSWRQPDNLWAHRDLDIMYNTIYNIGDDAIEVDGGGVNMRIYRNKIRNAFAAISMAPVERGPVYCTYNDATYYMIMFKLNVGGSVSNGWAYSYHNSAYCLSRGDVYGGSAISFPLPHAISVSNKVFMNNAFIVDGMGVRFGYDDYTIDYNCYYNVPGDGDVYFRWLTKKTDLPKERTQRLSRRERRRLAAAAWDTVEYTTIESFRAASGKSTNGMVADPMFRDTPRLGKHERVDYIKSAFSLWPQLDEPVEGDFSLAPGSPCIDRGVYIRGINDDFVGKAPDIGAWEHDGKGASPLRASGLRPLVSQRLDVPRRVLTRRAIRGTGGQATSGTMANWH